MDTEDNLDSPSSLCPTFSTVCVRRACPSPGRHRHNNMRVVVIIIASALCALAAAESQISEIATLKNELADMKRTMARMEANLARLEDHGAPSSPAPTAIRVLDAGSPVDSACPCSTTANPCPPKNESYSPGAGACCHGLGPDAPCETDRWDRTNCNAAGFTWCPVPEPPPGPAPAPMWGSSVTAGDSTQGTTTFAVAQYFTDRWDDKVYYLHLRMPSNFDRDVYENHMFHVTVTGYAYMAAAPIDLVFVGYDRHVNRHPSARPEILSASVLDRADGKSCTSNSTSYWGSDQSLYLRFQPWATSGGQMGGGNTYYTSFRVDSMLVGNGLVIKQGDISVILSEKATI